MKKEDFEFLSIPALFFKILVHVLRYSFIHDICSSDNIVMIFLGCAALLVLRHVLFDPQDNYYLPEML